MSAPPAPSAPAPNPSGGDAPVEAQWNGTSPIIHYSAIGLAVVCPLTLLLPSSRKGGVNRLQNMILGGGAFWGFNQLAYDFTGTSIYQRSNERWGKILSPMGLPEKAQQNKALMEAERARREALLPAEDRAAAEARRRQREEADLGALDRLMGAEKGWREKRDEKEKEALASGKGYWDLIMEHISEAWPSGGGDKKKQQEEGDAKNNGDGEAGKKP